MSDVELVGKTLAAKDEGSMTLFNVTTTYTPGADLTAWPDGDVTNFVTLDEDGAIPGRFTGVLDDAYGNVWYGFDGTSAPTTYDTSSSSGPKKVFDLTQQATAFGSSVVFNGSQPERVSGTTITVFKDENTPVTITLSSGSLTGLTLEFVIEDKKRGDLVVINNASITRTSNTFTVTIPSTFTANLNNCSWSLRDVTASAYTVLMYGVITVQYAASKDA